MNLAELTVAVTEVMRGPLYCYAKSERYAILAAHDVFAIIPTQHMCGMRVYESISMPPGEFRIMRWSDVKEILIAEDRHEEHDDNGDRDPHEGDEGGFGISRVPDA